MYHKRYNYEIMIQLNVSGVIQYKYLYIKQLDVILYQNLE